MLVLCLLLSRDALSVRGPITGFERLDQQLLAVDIVSGKHPLFIGFAGKLRTSAHHATHTTFRRRSPLAQTGATRPHTTGYQRPLSPRNKHPEMNSEPRHFKARHSMNRPQTPLIFVIPPRVSRPAPLA